MGVSKRKGLFDTQGLDQNTIRNMWFIICAVMGGTVWTSITTGVAFSGFWKKIGASDLTYGVVCAFPCIACGLQFIASYLLERSLKRKKIYVIASMIQRCVWIPFALVPVLIPMEQTTLRIWACALLALVSATMTPVMNVAFYSILNDVVPKETRGHYLGVRTVLSTIVGSVIGVVIGYVLDVMPGMQGYTLVFIVAAIFGLADNTCYVLMKLPPMHATPRKSGVWKMLLRVLQDKKFMRVVLFCTAWLFAVQVSSPYFYVYLNVSVHMTNLQITVLCQTVNNLALVLFAARWGRGVDRFGSKPIMMIGCVISGIYTMLMCLVGRSTMWLCVPLFFICGFSWTSYDLASQSLFMRESGAENTSMYTAVFFMFTQLFGQALGGATGGYLLDSVFSRLEPLNLSVLGFTLSRYNFLFVIGGIFRILATVIFVPRIFEDEAHSVREVLTHISEFFRISRRV